MVVDIFLVLMVTVSSLAWTARPVGMMTWPLTRVRTKARSSYPRVAPSCSRVVPSCSRAAPPCTRGDVGKGLSFQSENQLTASSHASLLLDTNASVSDLSVCTWLKVYYFREATSYVFSYATSDKRNNELNLGIKSDQVFIAVGGSYVYGLKNSSRYFPEVWYHVCFVADHRNSSGIFYVNGELDRTRRLSRRNILLNGSVVLGQETDKVNGGYSAEQSFSGIITGFNWYSRALSAAEVRSLAQCGGGGGDVEGDLVGWSSAQWDLNGPVTPLEEDFCSPEKFRFFVIPKRRTHEEANLLCNKLKTTVALPGSAQENTALYDAAAVFLGQCQPPNHATVFFWLGTNLDSETRVWTDSEGQPLNFSNFEGPTHSKKFSCGGFRVPPYEGKWSHTTCHSIYKFCVGCQEQRPTVFKMRGLCEQYLHSTFFRVEDQRGEMPAFRGFTKYHLSYENSTWSLLNTWTGDVVASNFTYASELPIGRKMWRITSNFALCDLPKGTMHELSLSACYDWEYTCGEGTCIDLTQRCDLRVDCPDNSDETGCDKLSLPNEYLETLPPPGVDPGPLSLNISIRIQSFSEVNIRDMKLTVDFSTIISWYDQRIGFQNLKPLSDLNYVKPTSVWTPKLELVNADFPNTYTTDAVLTVVRASPPKEDEAWRPTHDEVYEGRRNPLQLSQKLNAPFSCAMDLRNFPFDTQQCLLSLRLTSAGTEFLQWRNMSVDYLGEVLLTEYEVWAPLVRQGLVDGYSTAVVTIKLHRRYAYYLTSAYLPTIMLMFISYASLFCQRENRDLRVMMAITTLLVLYALYQQISDGLPRTSYTKAIDVWCFFAITFIFSQVIFHVAIDVKITWSRRLHQSPRGKELDQPPKDKTLRRYCCCCNPLVAARVAYAALFLLFCVIYWCVVLTNTGAC